MGEKERIILKPVKEEHVRELERFYPAPVARILVIRGVKNKKEAEAFLNPSLSFLRSPFLFREMEYAVERVIRGIERKERILVWGDEDVDGITSAVLLYRTLLDLGAVVDVYIPDRRKEGFGLSKKGIDKAKEKNITLIITVDSGVTSVEEIKYAKELGIDVIITDHHEGIEPSGAYATVDPKVEPYPFPHLAGVGVSFKFSWALVERRMKVNLEQWMGIRREFLMYVAIGTLSDRVPLVDENRIFYVEGLKVPEEELSPPLKIIKERELQNALPILQSGKKGMLLRFLLSTKKEEAATLFEEMRKKSEAWWEEARQAFNRICRTIEEQGYVVYLRDLPYEFIGYCASRAKEMFRYPAIVMTKKGDRVVGECRAPRDFDAFSLLQENERLLLTYGGHRPACGFSIKEENLGEFIKRARAKIKEWTPKETLEVDAEIRLEEVDERFLELIEKLEPHGEGNPRPLFLSSCEIERADDGTYLKKGNARLKIRGGWIPPGADRCDPLVFRIEGREAIIKECMWEL
ncbi:hypothetical protein DRQ20_01790 [bacterium]|nr:MAG: hypothetical protein DRQ20_01790 [bacterium]